MSKRVYISADYSENDGDCDVVTILDIWGSDSKHKVDFVDMSKVISGSVSDDSDCRACDLKLEFNRQINASSVVIFVVGDKTKSRTAGSICPRVNHSQQESCCTPYKQNVNGEEPCKVGKTYPAGEDVGCINQYSYLQHEYEQASKKSKHITVVYNSLRKESTWLPEYLKSYEDKAQPFWIKNEKGEKVGNYVFIKKELGYD